MVRVDFAKRSVRMRSIKYIGTRSDFVRSDIRQGHVSHDTSIRSIFHVHVRREPQACENSILLLPIFSPFWIRHTDPPDPDPVIASVDASSVHSVPRCLISEIDLETVVGGGVESDSYTQSQTRYNG